DDGERAQRVDRRQQVALGKAAAERSGDVRAEDVEQAAQGERRRRNARREAAVLEVARHVHADEGELEAADEVAGSEELEAAVADRLAQGGADALLLRGRLDALRLAQTEGERNDEKRR